MCNCSGHITIKRYNSYPVIDQITRNFCGCYSISASVSHPQKKHLDSLKSRAYLPKIARMGIGMEGAKLSMGIRNFNLQSSKGRKLVGTSL